MSVYVLSDIHGCDQEFDQMLKLIDFTDYDELYIIGDVCDRGSSPIALYQKIMKTPNIHLILGNHEDMFLYHIDTLMEEKRSGDTLTHLSDISHWLIYNGGFVTADQFLSLPFSECYDLKTYLEGLPLYQHLQIMGQKYLLVHAGVGAKLQRGVSVSAIDRDTLLWEHIPLEANPFTDTTMIVGHLPTFTYGEEYDGKMIFSPKTKTYHIDCGCVFGRSLGCLRLDDLQEFYIPSTYPYIRFKR
ncbi:MAG: fructose-bisphosphatase class III [Solobacterium sp.]|nr:fructose-bisphosphatase class III [Solobacterium sp.]